MIDIKDMYAQCVVPELSKYKSIYLSRETLEAIDVAAETLARAKLNETSYRKDGASLKTRFKTGFKGEAAVEQLLGIKFMNLDSGLTLDFDHPDIEEYGVGVKTVRYGNFPIAPVENHYPQIICIVDPENDSRVLVCGLADVDTLNKYQSKYLIVDPNLRDKGTKAGFYGFRALKPVTKLEDIEGFVK